MRHIHSLDQGTASPRAMLFERRFEPALAPAARAARLARWREAVSRARGWAEG